MAASPSPSPDWAGGEFLSTHWTTVLTAGQEHSPAARQAMESLCATYWYPLYAYVRRQGHDVADAQDLTQDFFARFLELKYVQLADPNRGRFRTFLLTSLKHFLVNEWNKANRLKRGGGTKTFSLDEEEAEERFAAEPATEQTPDMTFDQGWATTLFDHALTELGKELATSDKADSFEQLKGFVWGGDETSYAAVAKLTGTSEGAIKLTVHRLRRRFQKLLRAAVAQTVDSPADLEEEWHYLFAVVRKGS